ncbi:bifunctional peptidase and arginyl-hydroxylase JMJD5 [Uranotaenia lowii]|uniref:bifunctional peptidase and arginyl-hydroxylase JMJD5 n=1 Tax=Uranotaenia lowii TaxID=190385 RepID=UPI0024791B79|nr:bifunctional peptidase and arginyl-hydroxylase JMJD5 [Uranotaenia lowii]
MSVFVQINCHLLDPGVVSKLDSLKHRKLYHDVVGLVLEPLKESQPTQSLEPNSLQDNLTRIGVLYEICYGSLHTGEWHAVPVEERDSFTLLSYLRILYMLLIRKESDDCIRDAIYLADIGLMLGSRIILKDAGTDADLLSTVAKVLSSQKGVNEQEPALKKLKVDVEVQSDKTCEVPVLQKPTLEYFGNFHYDKSEPAILEGVIDDWPAMKKWHDPNYLIGLAGERSVPVEFGSQYSNDDWSQRLVRFKDFIVDNLIVCDDTEKASGSLRGEKSPAYLAQHELFDQIPELREDIAIPDYIGRTDINPRIKAWLGPKGTISPLHTDPGHNLLCQVFGSKTIILASPTETPNLYPHEHFILNNTSQVDAANVDYDRFPRARDVRFRRLTLHRGQVLYIPPGWWHYVESLSCSFSVSFWFD